MRRPAPPQLRRPGQSSRGARALLRQFRPAILLTLVLTLIAGIIYPLAVTRRWRRRSFPRRPTARWSTSTASPIGSKLIGQYWTQPQYFHGRPSVTVNLQGTPAPYEANNSAGSNLGPTNHGR